MNIQKQTSLRGGGCKPCTQYNQSNRTSFNAPPAMPYDFQTRIRELADKIKQATLTSVDDKATLMNCFQYFFYNERAFNNMVEYQELAKTNVDVLLEIVAVMMDSAKLFLKSNPLYCYYCMQITAWIWRTLFWFYTRNDKRFLTADQQKGYMDQLNSIDQQLEIEGGKIYENSIKYELFVVKTIITLFPISSKEAKALMQTLTTEAIVSVATLSLTKDLKNALKQGAILLVNEGVKKYLENQYHQIHSIEKLKWQVINAIETSSESTTSLTKKLGQMYKQIEGSSWEIQYCWIKNIGNIIGVKLMALESEIGLPPAKIKQLQAENILLSVNSDEFIINLDASKLIISESAKLLFNKLQSLRKLSELQIFLLKGSNQIPSFEHYNLKFVDQANKTRSSISPSQYFDSKFKNLQFKYYIKIIEDTNEQITKVQKMIGCLDFKLYSNSKQQAKDLEELYKAREGVNELMSKLLNSNTFYIELGFIQQQWTKYIIHDVRHKDVKDEIFSQQILLTYLQLIQSIGQSLREGRQETQIDYQPQQTEENCVFSNEKLQFISEKLTQQVNEMQIQGAMLNRADQILDIKFKLKTMELTTLLSSNAISTPNLEYAINQRLIQISAAFQIHQCNIQTLIRIRACLRALINLIEAYLNNDQCQDVYPPIVSIQNMLKKQVCELVQATQQLPQELLDLVNQINPTEMDKVSRRYSPPSDDIMRTFQFQYYDQININMPQQTLVNIFTHFYKPLVYIDINSLSGKFSILSSILDELIEFISNQYNIKKQFVAFMKSITLLDCQNYSEYLEYWERLTRIIDQNRTNPQLENIYRIETQITQRHEAIQHNYSKMLSFNPYDQQITEQFEQQQNILHDLQKLIKLIIQMIKKQKKNGEPYINSMMNQMLQISKNQTIAESIVQSDVPQTSSSPLTQLSEYEESHQEFSSLLLTVQQQLQSMNEELTVVSEVYQTCSEVGQNNEWLQDLESQSSEQFKKFCNFAIQNYQVCTDQLFRVDSQLKSEILQIIQPEVQNQASYTEQLVDIIQSDKWKIRECTVFQLLQFSGNCLKIDSKQCADIIILRMKIYETNKQVRALLNHPSNLQQMNSILQQYWPSQQEIVVSEIKSGLKVLNSLLYELQQEQNADKRKKLQMEYQQKENEIQEQLSNVQEVGNALGITMLFIQDLKKDLAKIDQKIKEIQDNLMNMNADLQFLRGKTIYQLIDIRKSTILMNKRILDAKNIYIKISCVEKKFILNEDGKLKEIKYDSATYLYNTEPTDNEGEMNEFLNEDKKTMLIHGQAGSGKSTASRKIEEYFWELYEKTPNQEVRLVPIVIQLPSLQDPLHSALQETLKSDQYKFDVNQIRELKDEIDKQKLKLLIIMDSYDEIHQDYIGTNLIKTNKLEGWGHKNINHYPKVLVTTRSEVLNNSDYHEWFLAERQNDVKYYKEVRLERFDKQQRDTYIDCYLNLSVKKVITDSYFLMTNTQNEFQAFENFSKFWNQIKLEFNETKVDQLLSEQQIQYIIGQLLKDEHIQIQNTELQRNLRVLLQELKSGYFYKNTIQLINIENILETPFMMEIVVQVLPTLIKQKSQPEFLKPHFIEKFTQILNKNRIDSHENNQIKANDAWNLLIKDQSFLEDFSITMNKDKVKEKVLQIFQQPVTTPNTIQAITLPQDYVESLMSQRLTQYDFYNSFFELYFEKQIGKLKEQGMAFDYVSLTRELWKFAKNLAVQLSSQNKTQVEYKAQGLLYKKESKSWEDEFFDDDCKQGQFKKMFRSCIPIKQQTHTYSFNHKSLQEFLVAKDFIDNMENITINLKQQQTQQQISSTIFQQSHDIYFNNQATQELILYFQNHFINQKSWSVDFMKGVCTFIGQKVQNMPVIKDIMFLAVKLTKIQTNKLIMLGSNCLFMLQRMGENFMDRNLQDIHIQDIDLSNANFAHCKLDRSIMNNVNIAGINVFKASLRDVKWTNIQVSQIRPKIHNFEIDKLHYSKQSKLILISKFQLSNAEGETIGCDKQIKRTIDWCDKGYDYLLVQFDQHLASYDLSTFKKVAETQFNNSIKQIKCSKTHLFVLLVNADVIYFELPDITQQRRLEIKAKIQELKGDKTETIFQNIWLSRKWSEFAVYSKDIYSIQIDEMTKKIKAQRILTLTDQKSVKYSCILNLGLVNHLKLFSLKKEPRLEVDLKVDAKLIYFYDNDEEILVFTKTDMQLFNANNLTQKKQIGHTLDIMKKNSLSLDNSMLVTLHDNKVGIWNLRTFEQIQVLQHQATCCALDREMKVLALGNESELQYQDLKSLTTQKQLNFKDVKFARNSHNFIAMTTDNKLYYFNVQSHNEVKWNLLMHFNEVVNLYFSPNGTRALVSMKEEKKFIIFDCLNGKNQERFGFCKSKVMELENEEIMFIKGAQLYKCQRQKDVATIVSPIEQSKVVQNISYFQIVNDVIFVSVNGKYLKYQLSKHTQDKVEVSELGNVTKTLLIHDFQLYIIDNKQVIDKLGQTIYANYNPILDSCTIDEQCLILLHARQIVLLYFQTSDKKSLKIRQNQINVSSISSHIIAIRNNIVTASRDTLIIYSRDSLEIIDKVPLVGNINKMILLNDNMIAITTDNLRLYVWDSESFQILSELKGQQDVIADLSFNPNHNNLISRSVKNYFVCWNISRDECKQVYSCQYAGDQQKYNISQIVYGDKPYIYWIENNCIYRESLLSKFRGNTHMVVNLQNEYHTPMLFTVSQSLVILCDTQNKLWISNDQCQTYTILCEQEQQGNYNQLSISNDEQYLLTALNAYEACHIWSIKEKQQKFKLEFNQILEIHFLDQGDLLVKSYNNSLEINIFNIEMQTTDTVAVLNNDIITADAQLNGFSIAHKDSSIDVYVRSQNKDKIRYLDRYVRQSVFNNSSNQPIQSYETDLTGAQIQSHFNLSLVELFHQSNKKAKINDKLELGPGQQSQNKEPQSGNQIGKQALKLPENLNIQQPSPMIQSRK